MEDSINTPKDKKYSLFLMILPDLNIDPGYIDQEYYEMLFKLFQSLDLNSDQRMVILSTERFFGYEKRSFPLSGGVSGFAKTLGHEFEIDVKHIYSDDLLEIHQELENWDDNVEISYSDSQRFSLVLSPIDETVSKPSKLSFGKKDILLVTGGGRGITFKCLEALCLISKPKV